MMKLLVLALVLASCWSQQGSPREVTWDYSEWQPILAPCPSCRQSRILQAKPSHISTVPIAKRQPQVSQDSSSVVELQPIFQRKLPKTLKPNIQKPALVPSQPPRTLAITFPPNGQPGRPTTPAVTSNVGGQVHLVYLPEGSIEQLQSAHAARIVPHQIPQQNLQGIETVPAPLFPQDIQAIDFSDKQKRDHEGRIIHGGVTNSLPMSLITTLGHEEDAREKLKLLEAALVSPIEQEDGKLPRVFIAPSHVPPPPGYVKIPLVPEGKSGHRGFDGNAPLPLTFLTPDARNPPPGFVKFDLPSAVSQLSRDIPVVVPNSQVEPNVIFNGPSFSPTPGPNRPDASLNFQAQGIRTGKNIAPQVSAVQVISKGAPKSTVQPKSPAPPKQAVTKPSPRPAIQTSSPPSFRPIPQRTNPQFPQANHQSQFFPPRQSLPLPQQFLPNPNQPRPFAPRPDQSGLPVFQGQPVFLPGQPFPHSGQPIQQPGQTFPRPGQSISQSGQSGQSVPQASQLFTQTNPGSPRPDHRFIQQNQQFPRPGQTFQRPNPPFPQPSQPIQNVNEPFSQPGKTFVQSGQSFSRPLNHFPQPNHPFPQPNQSFPQPNHPFPQPNQSFPQPNHPFPQPNQSFPQPGQSVFRSPHTQAQPDFPNINTPLQRQPQNPNFRVTSIPVSQPTTPEPPQSSPTTFSSLSPETSPETFAKSVAQFSSRPQLITQFSPKQFFSSTPRPAPFIQSSPSPAPVTQIPRFPPRPVTHEPFSTRSPQSSLGPFLPTSIPQFTARPVPVSSPTQHSPRPTLTSTSRPAFTSDLRSTFTSSPRPPFTSFTSTPRPPFNSFTSTPRPPFTSFTSTPRHTFNSFTSTPRHTFNSFTSTPRPTFNSFTSTPRPTFNSFTSTPKSRFTSTPRPTFNSFTSTPKSRFTSSPRPTFASTPRPTFTPTPRPLISSSPRPLLSSSPRPILTSSPRPILTSSPHPILSSTPRPQPTFTPQPTETSSPFDVTPRPPFQQTFGFEDSSIRSRIPQDQVFEIPSFVEPQHQQIPVFQEPQNHQFSSTEDLLAPQIPSFQRPQTTTVTRFPGPQSPRIPSFQRPTTARPLLNEDSEGLIESGRRQRLPVFPRFQRPRITTIAPEDEEQTILPEFTTPEFLTPAPTTLSPTTPSPATTTTVKVTTFKPKFNFNRGNRRPIIRRKPRPTEAGKKEIGEKKTEAVTLFPPFSVARTLNPLRNDNKENERIPLTGDSDITVPPAGAFGRRLRPRTKPPSVRSEDDSNVAASRPSGQRARGLVGNRARELPDWLKARRRNRGRFRGSPTTTENIRLVDSVLEDDLPLDILENNEFTGAESTLVVFSSPPENAVAESLNLQETEKPQERVIEKVTWGVENEDFRKVPEVVEVQVKYVDEASQEEVKYVDEASQEEVKYVDEAAQEEDKLEELNANLDLSRVSSGTLAEMVDPVTSHEDYSFETTEALSEPEPEPAPESSNSFEKTEDLPVPEPESSNKYVAEYDEYEDDTEDTPETYHTHDQPHRQPPSFPNSQPIQHTTIHTSAHSHPFVKTPINPSVENLKMNPIEREVVHLVDEIDDSTERYVGNKSSDESEPVTNLPLDKETDAQTPNDTEVNIEGDFESVAIEANFSYIDNNSKGNPKTHQLEEEGEEDADGKMDGESQEPREDSYQGYRTESPAILSLFPNDYFTALSPGQLQDYDYYEYDSYEDGDYVDGTDQDFGGSSAQVVFAVPVTEYYPEETTLMQEHLQNIEEEIIQNNEFVEYTNPTTEEVSMTTEAFGLEIENEYMTTEIPMINNTESTTDSMSEVTEVTTDYDITTLNPEEEVTTLFTPDSSMQTTINPDFSMQTTIAPDSSMQTTITPDSFVQTTITTAAPSTTTSASTTTTTTTASPTTARPASIRPLYARLQSAGKKAAQITDKKISNTPKILGQSTVTEIWSSDPVICFRDNRCVRARRQRRRRSNRP